MNATCEGVPQADAIGSASSGLRLSALGAMVQLPCEESKVQGSRLVGFVGLTLSIVSSMQVSTIDFPLGRKMLRLSSW